MATKRKFTKKRDLNQITAAGKPDEDQALAIARTVLRPTVQAAVTLKAFGERFGDLDLQALIEMLSVQILTVSEQDLGRAEGMLVAQAHTLDAIFNNLARRAAANAGEGYLRVTDTYLRMALRAQSERRATWESISAIQNPPIARYVGQANVAQGHQQVNNGVAAHARETESRQNKLLEELYGQRLDTGPQGKTGGFDPAMEAVGAVDGAADRSR